MLSGANDNANGKNCLLRNLLTQLFIQIRVYSLLLVNLYFQKISVITLNGTWFDFGITWSNGKLHLSRLNCQIKWNDPKTFYFKLSMAV